MKNILINLFELAELAWNAAEPSRYEKEREMFYETFDDLR